MAWLTMSVLSLSLSVCAGLARWGVMAGCTGAPAAPRAGARSHADATASPPSSSRCGRAPGRWWTSPWTRTMSGTPPRDYTPQHTHTHPMNGPGYDATQTNILHHDTHTHTHTPCEGFKIRHTRTPFQIIHSVTQRLMTHPEDKLTRTQGDYIQGHTVSLQC